MVLRLDPRLPLLWRSPSSLQLGLDDPVVLDQLSSAAERVIAALSAGVSESGLRMIAASAGLAPTDLESLMDRAARALEPPRPAPRRLAIVGSGPLAREIAAQLEGLGARVGAGEDPELVLLAADWMVGVDDHGRWLSRDIPHLPIVAGSERVEVGPRVVPGSGPCLYCVHLARCDADPAWPAIATQLLGREPAALGRTAVAEAAAFAVRRAVEEAVPGRAWAIPTGGGAISARDYAAHPACLCRALPGIDSARGTGRAPHPVPTTA